MPLAKQNLFVDQGATFSETIQLLDDEGLPVDLSGYSGTGQIRKHHASANASANLTVSILYAEGTIVLGMNANTTGLLAAGRYVYDVEIANSNGTIRALEGMVTVVPQATK